MTSTAHAVPISSQLDHWLNRFVALVAVAGIWLGFVAAMEGQAPLGLRWLAVAVGFFLSELGVVHLKIGRSAFSVTLHETILVIALLSVHPSEALVGVLAGPLVAMVAVQRLPFTKVLFNCGQYLVWAALACIGLRAIPATIQGPALWTVLVVLMLALSLFTGGLIAVAMRLADGTSVKHTIRRSASSSLAMTTICTTLGLFCLSQRGGSLDRLWLLVPVGAAVHYGQRSHQALRAQHTRLEILHDTTAALSGHADLQSAFESFAQRCLSAFDAQTAYLMMEVGDDHLSATVTGQSISDWSLADSETQATLTSTVRAANGCALVTPGQGMLSGLVAELQATSLLVAPVRHGARDLGVLVLAQSSSLLPFQDHDRRLLAAVTEHASSVLQLGRLHADYRAAVVAGDGLRADAELDPLTGTFGRFGIVRRIDEFLTTDPACPPGVLAISLTSFEPVNDLYGWAAGDELLCAVTRRLQCLMRDGDLVGRVGGDEFILLVPSMSETFDLDALADRVQRQLSAPYRLKELGETVHVGARVACTIADQADGNAVLRSAALALQRRRLRDLLS